MGICCLPGFVSCSLSLCPGKGVGKLARGRGDVYKETSLQAEEAEREERKRLESQREAEWKKEEERLRLQEEQKVRLTPDTFFQIFFSSFWCLRQG